MQGAQAPACQAVMVPVLRGLGYGDTTRRKDHLEGQLSRELDLTAPKKTEEERDAGGWSWAGMGGGPVGGRVEIAVGICSLGVKTRGV